ncbi:MAG: S1 RNA-binding domain-containing protein [Enterobacteriaceae bacterium PSpicST1]|nr:MAG: S1 RNA-binding domain-containing protein [Enterobacteriaceae bacterium PSpicST1]
MIKKFNKIFKKVFKKINIKPGLLIKGYVISISKELVFIDVGLKSLATILIKEFKNKKKKIDIKLGDKIDVILECIDNGFGKTILSYEKVEHNKEWLILKNALKNSISMFGFINGRTKGGFNIKLNNIKAFLPGSLVDIKPVKDITYLEGKKLEFKIIKLDKKRNNIVVSRKAVIKLEYNSIKKKTIKLIKEGVIIKGVVKNLTDYGAFINIGGLDGLLHITDMSWKRIRHPSDIVNIGDVIILKIIKFNSLNKRISLGLKQRSLDPWNNIIIRYPKGSITKGRVSNLTNYGCFVKLEDGVEGLVHTSEMEWKKKNINPYKFIKINKQINVMILNIDTKKRRISLGIKQCKINPWKFFHIKKETKCYVNGIIKSITDFGIFVGLFDGIDGLIHLTDISWDIINKKNINKYKKGDKIKSIILQVNVIRERISLGIKQLNINNFSKFLTIYKKNNFIYCKIILIKKKKIKINLGNKLIGYLNIIKNNIFNLFNNKKIIKLNFLKILKKKIVILTLF